MDLADFATFLDAPRSADPTRVASVHRDGHRFILVRHATDADHRAELVRAAQVISHREIRAVEPFVHLISGTRHTTLVTGFVGERSVASHPPRTVEAFRALAIATMQAMDEMHAAGITHGPVAASQIVFDPLHRPVFCGFGNGNRTDRPQGTDWLESVAQDRRSLARLLTSLRPDHPENHRRATTASIGLWPLTRTIGRWCDGASARSVNPVDHPG